MVREKLPEVHSISPIAATLTFRSDAALADPVELRSVRRSKTTGEERLSVPSTVYAREFAADFDNRSFSRSEFFQACIHFLCRAKLFGKPDVG